MILFRNLLIGAILATASAAVWAAKININQADADALTALDGIGAAKAAAIVEYRERIGNFKTLEDLANVKGIGLATVQKNRDAMTTGKGEGRRRASAD